MRQVCLVILVLCLGAAPTLAHSVYFSPWGWSGPYANGGGDGHPEKLCENFTGYVCMVAAAHSFGYGLGAYRIDFWVAGGSRIEYTTNTESTKGWIVVISTPDRWYYFEALPGSYGGQQCDAFEPGTVAGRPTQTYGASRYYYQSSQNGYKFGPFYCNGVP